jgi:hypothetical protein
VTYNYDQLGVNRYECPPPENTDCSNMGVESGVTYRYESKGGVSYQVTFVVGNTNDLDGTF